jgi:regulatory protein
MPVITRLAHRKSSPSRCAVYVDGKPALTCRVALVQRLGLAVGRQITSAQIEELRAAELRHRCLDAAVKLLSVRLHSRSELERKLQRKGWQPPLIAAALDELTRMGYVDDRRFAQIKAQSAAEYRHHGPHRAMRELLKSGVDPAVARTVIEDVYEQRDSLAAARAMAQKQAPRLRRLDRSVARRRLAGMLLRRGYDYDTIRPVLDEVLGDEPGDEPDAV